MLAPNIARNGMRYEILRQDRRALLQDVQNYDTIILRLRFGYGVAAERAVEQLESYHKDFERHPPGHYFSPRPPTLRSHRVIVNIKEWFRSGPVYETPEEVALLDARLVRCLRQWLRNCAEVVIHPRPSVALMVDSWADDYVPMAYQTHWIEFDREIEQRRFLDVLA